MPGADLDRDESIRPDTSRERLAALRPVFRADGTVTAGNASPLNDGASAALLGSEAAGEALGLSPLARIAGRGAGRLRAAVLRVRARRGGQQRPRPAGIGWSDVAAIELNEAFAAQSLACIRGWGVDPAIVNAHGGAIAIGHPLAPRVRGSWAPSPGRWPRPGSAGASRRSASASARALPWFSKNVA